MADLITEPLGSASELTEQNKVISLFEFIRELNKIKQKAIHLNQDQLS